jgi:hypothetical protein
MSYEKITLTLNKNQARKLIGGKVSTLNQTTLSGKKHYLNVHPQTARKIKNALKKGKGVRVCITPDELNASGEGIKEFLQGAKNLGKKIKEKVIDTDIYQKYAKPVVRKGVDKLLDIADPYLSVVSPYVRKGVNKLGEYTGAYGLHGGRINYYQLIDLPPVLMSNQSHLLSPLHPAMRPIMSKLPDIGNEEDSDEEMYYRELANQQVIPRKRRTTRIPRGGKMGGSFKVAGY